VSRKILATGGSTLGRPQALGPNADTGREVSR